MTYTEIHIWGDSVARGVTLDERRQRYVLSPQRCSERLKAVQPLPVTDRSVMGATVLDGLKRFADAPACPGALCAIEYGGNDCDLNWADVAQDPQGEIIAKVPLEQYADGLRQFALGARERGMQPLFVTPPPLNAPRYFAWVTRGLDAARVLEALGDVERIYRWQERYTIAMRRVAMELSVKVLDVRDMFLAHEHIEELTCRDGIHPSDEGHRLIAELAVERVKVGSCQ